jgi:hypothetical protein
MSNKEITNVLEYQEFDDCEGCGWRIQYCPTWKVFVYDMTDEYSKYNHSVIREIKKTREGNHPLFEVTIAPWNRKPGEPELVLLEDVSLVDIRKNDTSGSWHHLSLNHPSFSGDTKGVCGYARRADRCPKCKSLQCKTTQEAWGNSTDCPECGYHSFYSIGD